SHDSATLNTSTVRPPYIHTFSFDPLNQWHDFDVGAVGQPGGTTYDNGTYTVRGAGGDMWGTADAFHYLAQQAPYGNGQIVARVTSVQNTNPYAKAGVDMRLGRGGSASDAHVVLDVRPTGDIEFMTRTSNGATTTY